MKNFLALDTSSTVLSVALKTKNNPIKQLKVNGLLRHSENLMPAINRLFNAHRSHPQNLDAVLIDRGPGSFTGLRIGYATMKGLLSLEKKPCFGGMSLDMIAHKVPVDPDSKLCVSLDARREKFYARLYEVRDQRWMPINKLEVVAYQDFLQSLPEHCIVTGNVIQRYGELIQKAVHQNKNLRLMSEKFWYPQASVLIDWLEHHMAEPSEETLLQPLRTATDFIPRYFRMSEAEEKRNQYAVC